MPSAALTTIAYGQRLSAWLDRVQKEDEAPTAEQLAVLYRVVERGLQEFRMEHEGLPSARKLRHHSSGSATARREQGRAE